MLALEQWEERRSFQKMKTCSERALVPPDLAHDFTLVSQLSRGRGIICQSTSSDAYTRHRNVQRTHLSMYVDEKGRLYLGDLVDLLLFVVLHFHNHLVYHLLVLSSTQIWMGNFGY